MPVNSFKWKHYEGEIILLNVRWYLKYALSYINLKEMMAERGIQVDYSTIIRWVHQYSPEIEKKYIDKLKYLVLNNSFIKNIGYEQTQLLELVFYCNFYFILICKNGFETDEIQNYCSIHIFIYINTYSNHQPHCIGPCTR